MLICLDDENAEVGGVWVDERLELETEGEDAEVRVGVGVIATVSVNMGKAVPVNALISVVVAPKGQFWLAHSQWLFDGAMHETISPNSPDLVGRKVKISSEEFSQKSAESQYVSERIDVLI
jgi:hypothetical protein